MVRLDKYGMNKKQRKFADKYILCGNAAEAYRYAYNPKADDKKAANYGSMVLHKNSVKQYIEKRQAELEQTARESGMATPEEIIEFCTGILRGDIDPTDFTVDILSEGPMGASVTKKDKHISRQWAIEKLISLLGADKSAGKNQFQVIIEMPHYDAYKTNRKD